MQASPRGKEGTGEAAEGPGGFSKGKEEGERMEVNALSEVG